MAAACRAWLTSARRSPKTASAIPSILTRRPCPITPARACSTARTASPPDVEIPDGGAEGALVSFGGVDGGYSLYIQNNRLQYVQNYVARDYLHVESTVPVPAGHHELRFEFEVTGRRTSPMARARPGRGQLYIDGQLVGQADFPHTTPFSLGLTGGITVGADPGAPVAPFYETPFEFTGTVHSVTFDVSGDVIADSEAEMRRILARQ